MKKKVFTHYLIFVGLLGTILLNRCIDPYRPELNKVDSENILVVEGLITNEPGSFEVILSRSVALDTIVNFLTETGANVYILDDRGIRYDLDEVSPGRYKCLDDNVKVESGVSYQLFIIDAYNNDYESTPVIVEKSPELEEVSWEEVTTTVFEENEVLEKKAINVFVNTDDPSNQTKFYKWDIIETWKVLMPNAITALDGYGMPYETNVIVPDEKKYCWVTKESKNILVKSVDNQTDSKVNKFMVKKIGEEEDRLFLRYAIEVKQYRINQDIYEFWKKLKDVNESAGSLFDQVPSSTFGNISCCNGDTQALGYFNAVDVKSKRIFIERGQHSVSAENYYEGCLYVSDVTSYHFVDQFFARSKFCADCRNYGSNIKPEFW